MDEKIVAIIAIAILGITATIIRLDGYLLAVCVAAIAGLTGFKPPPTGEQGG